jgi:hypothetical protein
MTPSTARRIGALNHFFDEWRAIVYIATAGGLFGSGVLLPNVRIAKLEAQQSADHKALAETTQYLRVLATATCLSDDTTRKADNRMMTLLCDRVLRDQSILAMPAGQ